MSRQRKSRYLAAAEQAVRDAETRLATYNGPCRTCRFYLPCIPAAVCLCPVVEAAAVTITDDYAADRVIECVYQRDTSTIYGPVVCGPDGEFHEEAVIPHGWFLFLVPLGLILAVGTCNWVAA